VDEALAQRNRKRPIMISSPSFYPLVLAIEYSDMLAVVPGAVAQALALHEAIGIHDIPLDVPEWPLLMAWTSAGQKDPGLCWLRDFIGRVYGEAAPKRA
jgi:DNA-binding transcriptional LysR family regulator